jgi:organic hydroperoxide reductase OsmC/OhrA
VPSLSEIDALHEKAHAECYLANSVAFEIRCELQL